VYVLASVGKTLYAGVTNDLEHRAYEHREGMAPSFTGQYRIARRVHFEETSDIHAALAREKQIKVWTRAKKIALIESSNHQWRDLAEGWYDKPAAAKSFRAQRGISTVPVATSAGGNPDSRDSSVAHAPPE
jgi:putative endonuclease